jgi:hypothetical protein
VFLRVQAQYLAVIARSASDEAIHITMRLPWIASLALAMTGLLRSPRRKAGKDKIDHLVE